MGSIVIDGKLYGRIPHGSEVRVAPDGTRYPLNYSIPCWMCHAPLGTDHAVNCGIEQCPRCLHQWAICPCGKLVPPATGNDRGASIESDTESDEEADAASPFYFAMTREHLDTLADQIMARVVMFMQGQAYIGRQIEELAHLRDEGVLTVAEFEEKKAELLGRI